MVKSNADRQREFRAKTKGKFRKLEALLPCNEFSLLSGNAKELGLTKANYIVGLLHGNDKANQDGAVVGEDETLLHDNGTGNQDSISELEAEITYLKGLRSDKELRKDNRELLLKIEKLEASASVDQDTINRLIAEKDNNKPAKTSLEPRVYNGNAKGFKAVLVSILGNDNNVVSAERKRAYAALNIITKANGQLKSDSERVAVYEWLKDNFTGKP